MLGAELGIGKNRTPIALKQHHNRSGESGSSSSSSTSTHETLRGNHSRTGEVIIICLLGLLTALASEDMLLLTLLARKVE
jgi:hypothetical protein